MGAEPPPGTRKKIMEAYRDNIVRIWSDWERLHSSDDQRKAPADKQDRER